MAAIQNIKESKSFERTIVVTGVPFGNLNDEEVMADILWCYFQKANGQAVEVENVTYPTRIKGVAFVTFKEIKDVENILKKKKYHLTDMGLFSTSLTVSHFSENVIDFIFVQLDLSIFGKEVILENLVAELKEKIPSLNFSPLKTNGIITVKGSFLAIKKLKEILLLRASSLHENNTNFATLRKQKDKEASSEWNTSMQSIQPAIPDSARKEHIVILDTDVFEYMKYVKKLFENIFKEYGIVSKETVGHEVTTICLKDSRTGSYSDNLKKTKELIENISYAFSFELQKETLFLDELCMKERKHIELACQMLELRYPEILVKYNPKHIDIIGNSTDTCLFKKLVMKIARKDSNFRKHNKAI